MMNKKIKITFVILALIAIVAVFLAIKLSMDVQRLKSPQAIAKEEVIDIVAAVSKVMTLPQDETPTIATVVDPDKVRGQEFFANTEKGDKILIYTTAKKAILWRPSTNQVIKVSALDLPNS